MNKVAIEFTVKHSRIPIIVGSKKLNVVHFILLVSLYIVNSVVPHGKWNSENNIVHNAVTQVQPLVVNMFFSCVKFSYSVSVPVDRYAISIIGNTISFAGSPKINAIRITPSNPINLANGFRKFEMYARTVNPFI